MILVGSDRGQAPATAPDERHGGRTMGPARRVLGVLAAVAAVSVPGLPSASAAPPGDGMLRLAHLSPDTPAVDVHVDPVSQPGAGTTLAGVGYGTVSDYQAVAPGTYTVSVRGAGAPADSPARLSTTVEVQQGSARTVAGMGSFADLGLSVLDDDLSTPPAGQARVRLVLAAASARTISASVGGTAVSSGLGSAEASEYVDVPGGTTTLQVTPDGGTPADLPVDLAAGSVYSLMVLDGSAGGLTVSTVLDGAGPGVVPVGGVEAGAGGAAAAGGLPVGGSSLAVLALVALVLTVRARFAPRGGSSRHAGR
jgi:uncharacterized protein DUF4397